MLERVVLTSSIQAHGLSLTFLVAKMDLTAFRRRSSSARASQQQPSIAAVSGWCSPQYDNRLRINTPKVCSGEVQGLKTAVEPCPWTRHVYRSRCWCSRRARARMYEASARHEEKVGIRSRCAACEALASFESRERKKMKLMREHRLLRFHPKEPE
jgi:hypothetical protein